MKPPTYPPPDERATIIARREHLMDALVSVFVTSGHDETEADAQMHALIRQYGQAEVFRLFAFIADRLDEVSGASPSRDQAYLDYLRLYRRFGADRQFLDAATFAQRADEVAELKLAHYEQDQPIPPAVEQRIEELNDLLLLHAILWEDLVVEAPPPPEHPVWQLDVPPAAPMEALPLAPATPVTRTQKKIGRNAPCWCGSGRTYKHCHLREDEQRGR